MSDDRTPAHIRNSAAVSLKNFVRANWADGDAPLPETEREDLRNALLLRAFQVFPPLTLYCYKKILSEC